MAFRRTAGYVTALLAIVSLVKLATGEDGMPQPKQEELPSARSSFAVAVSGFQERYTVEEPVPLLVAFGYNGDAAAYVRYDLTMVVNDAAGHEVVPTEPIETPPTPNLGWYMERNGKQVLTLPVTIFEPGQAMAELNKDALADWRSLDQGTYYVRAVARVRIFEQEDIIIRKDMKPTTWVEAVKDADPLEQFSVRSEQVKVALVAKEEEPEEAPAQ